ncbi:hypothetical protein [Woeseia oceani]|uniref:Uncharacterized protein n=1 Tax=Woeseia oceani TaxID=1548547 RepID=A0A193LCE1_9GAMM|nr:hypothetical protein [Woeseia oceani]ANO50064.1 hypothetical protein BA177_01455 [Woeseia oceani]
MNPEFQADVWAPIVVSVLALVFAVLGFWWMNWRPGKLNVGNIRLFAAGKATEGSESHNVVIVTLPLILWNSGARPLVVDDLRLVPDQIHKLPNLLFEAVDEPLTTSILEREGKIDRNYFFLPLALRSNEIRQANCVFEARNCLYTFEDRQYRLKLEARLTGKSNWNKIKSIELDFSNLNDIEMLNLNEMYTVFPYRVEKSG